MNRFGLCWLGVILSLIVPQAEAVVSPAPDRAFGTNSVGQDVLTLMGREPGNPAVNQTVVRLRNLAPVNVNGDAVLIQNRRPGFIATSIF